LRGHPQFGDENAVACTEKMGAERDDPLARADAADECGFVAELADLHGTAQDSRSGIDDPYARGFPIVVERTERDTSSLGTQTVTVAPSGARDASPSSTYRAS
jgi:hypothetical protein